MPGKQKERGGIFGHRNIVFGMLTILSLGIVAYRSPLYLQAASVISEPSDGEKQENQQEPSGVSQPISEESQDQQEAPIASELPDKEILNDERVDSETSPPLEEEPQKSQQEVPVLPELLDQESQDSQQAVSESAESNAGNQAGESGEDEAEVGTVIEKTVPIYNYDIINVVVPLNFNMALNPYELPVRMIDGTFSTDQILSGNYGIINKSSADKIVTVTLTVEDLNGDKIVFVDSAQEAENADENTYAIYLAVIPGDESPVMIGENTVGKDTTAEELSGVTMSGANQQAVALHEGTTQISFRLSRASYNFQIGENVDSEEPLFKLTGLAPDGKGATAFTFGGTMNRKADWTKLLNGIKVSVVYTYKTADGSEPIVEGTGAMTVAD